MLEKLYCEMGGPGCTNNTNWSSANALNTWYGVTTDEQGRVITLVLGNNRLSGSIPAELRNLRSLEFLNVAQNPRSYRRVAVMADGSVLACKIECTETFWHFWDCFWLSYNHFGTLTLTAK